MKTTPRDKWITAGLQALAIGGPDAVRVEALAKSLGVTKGGFYGCFSGRGELLDALLDEWERVSVDAVLERVQRDLSDPRAMLIEAGRQTFSDEHLPVDLAVRDWARRDPQVAARLKRVDTERMALLRNTIRPYCDDPDEVEARSLLAFCAAIGSHFLAAEHQGRSREDVMRRASALLLAPLPEH